jgi:hypothetical protein
VGGNSLKVIGIRLASYTNLPWNNTLGFLILMFKFSEKNKKKNSLKKCCESCVKTGKS